MVKIALALLLGPVVADLSTALEDFAALSSAEQQRFLIQVQKTDLAAEPPSAVCAGLCAPACESAAAGGEAAVDGCMGRCNRRCARHTAEKKRPGALSDWITFNGAVQHVGITTSNLTRSVLFYTKVMGGVEVLGAGGDGWDGDDVYQMLMGAALARAGGADDWAADLSAGGKDTMGARYVSFDSVILEFLDYHSKEAELQHLIQTSNATSFPQTAIEMHDRLKEHTYPKFSDSNMAPSVAGNMHISFNVRPELDLNKFVTALENTSHALGYTEVFCNRVVPPTSVSGDGKPNFAGISEDKNSIQVLDGDFQGWALAYCKGPDGEQMEFNQVRDKAKDNFDQALQTYFAGGENPIWV